jgi:hypothetical protein
VFLESCHCSEVDLKKSGELAFIVLSLGCSLCRSPNMTQSLYWNRPRRQGATPGLHRARHKKRRFGSSHSNGINADFADGSVRSISYAIDPILISYLGNRSDGKFINASDF